MMNPYPPRSSSAKPFTVSRCHDAYFSQPLPGEPIDQRAASRASNDRFFRSDSVASTRGGGGRSSTRNSSTTNGRHSTEGDNSDGGEQRVVYKKKKWDGSIGENTTFSNPRYIPENDEEELRRERENREPFEFMSRRSRPIFHADSSDDDAHLLPAAKKRRGRKRRKILIHNGAVAEGARPGWSYSNVPEKKLVPDWIPENEEWHKENNTYDGGEANSRKIPPQSQKKKQKKKPTVRSILREASTNHQYHDDIAAAGEPTPSPRGNRNQTHYHRPPSSARVSTVDSIPRPPSAAAHRPVPPAPTAARPTSATTSRPPIAAAPPTSQSQRRPQSATTVRAPRSSQHSQRANKQQQHREPPQPPPTMVYKGGGIWEPSTSANTRSDGGYYSPQERSRSATAQFRPINPTSKTSPYFGVGRGKHQNSSTRSKSPRGQTGMANQARHPIPVRRPMSASGNGRPGSGRGGEGDRAAGTTTVSSYRPTPASHPYRYDGTPRDYQHCHARVLFM